MLMDRLVVPWCQDVPEIDFRDAVLEELRTVPTVTTRPTAPASAPRRVTSWTVALGSLATMLAVAVALRSGSNGPSVEIAEHGAPSIQVEPKGAVERPQPSPEIRVAQSADPAVREIGAKYAGWMQDATERISDTVAFVLAEDEGMPSDSMQHGESSTGEWLQEWSQRLEPFEQSLDRAFRGLVPSLTQPGSMNERTS